MHSIGVIIPCYNGAKFIEEAISSAMRQGDWVGEVLVIDDGSVDGSYDLILQECERDSLVRVLIHPHHANRGGIHFTPLGN
jgi:glycosyltransferase involved in cell wall biosynthesis